MAAPGYPPERPSGSRPDQPRTYQTGYQTGYRPGGESGNQPGHGRPPEGPGDPFGVRAGRLWAGGFATAIVAALIVVVGVLIARGILDIPVLAPERHGHLGDSTTTVYATIAAGCALLATGLLHLLLVAAPSPTQFFLWIVGLATVAAAVAPFARTATLEAKVVTGAINLVVGLAIMSLLAGVARGAMRSDGRPGQSPPPDTWYR